MPVFYIGYTCLLRKSAFGTTAFNCTRTSKHWHQWVGGGTQQSQQQTEMIKNLLGSQYIINMEPAYIFLIIISFLELH